MSLGLYEGNNKSAEHFMHFKAREFDPLELVVKKIKGNVYQPFLGTEGIVHQIQEHCKQKIIISDYDDALIKLFKHIRDRYEDLMHYLLELLASHCKETLRETEYLFCSSSGYGEDELEQSARLLYLTAWHGPKPERQRNYFHKRKLDLWHKLLQKAEIHRRPFDVITPNSGDFLYLEPLFDTKYYLLGNLIKVDIEYPIVALVEMFLKLSKRNINILLVADIAVITKVKRACKANNIFFERMLFNKKGWLRNYTNG